MINKFSARRQSDEGVALVFVMIFIAIVGVLISVGLSKSESTTLTGEQLRDRTQLQYALDAGVERGIQALRSDIANQTPASPASLCPTSSATATDITSSLDGSGMTLNGQTIGYSCQTLGGKAATPGNGFNSNFAILTTDPHSGALETQAGVSASLTVAGAIYLEGPEQNSDLKKPLLVQGDITSDISNSIYSGEDDCNARLQAATRLQLDPSVSGALEACTEQALNDALPPVSLPTAPTFDASAAAVNGINVPTLAGTCKVFFPGLYTNDPNLNTHGSNYFVSGLYYLKGIGSWTIQNGSDVIAGQRNAAGSDSPVPSSSTCAGMTDALAVAAAPAGQQAAINNLVWPYGSEFVFGGNSKLTVAGSLTMFSGPSTGNPGDPVAVNIYGARSSDTGYAASTVPNASYLLDNGNATSTVQFNAKLFAPENSFQLFASNPTTEVAPNGVVAYDLSLSASVAGSGLSVGAPAIYPKPSPAFRTIKVTAFDATGTNASTNVAVITLSNFSPFTARVKSWRTSCSGGGCP